MKTNHAPWSTRTVLAVVALLWSLPASALNPSVVKLLAKNTTPQVQPFFGGAIAANDKWILIGESGHDELGLTNTGAVHVFNAVTGKLVRVLRAPVPTANAGFGDGIAVHGDLALVGESFGDGMMANTGLAYLFRLTDGKFIRRFEASNGATGDSFGASVALSDTVAAIGARGVLAQTGAVYLFNAATGAFIAETTGQSAIEQFGWSLAISGSVVLVGAPGGNGMAAGSGVAYEINAANGAIMKKLVASDGAFDDGFGISVALHGKHAVIGAPMGHNSSNPETGAAYLFDVLSGGQLLKLEAPAWSGTDRFGNAVAINESQVFVGAPSADTRGGLYVLSVLTGQLVQEFQPADVDVFDGFAGTLAVAGNTVVTGGPNDDDLGSGAGAAYFIRPLLGLMPFFKSVGIKDSAPEAAGATFTAFGDPALNDDNETMFTGKLSGPGAASAGAWSNLNFSKTYDLALRKGDVDGGAVITSFGNAILNDASLGVFETSLAGPGAAGGRNHAIYGDNGTTVSRLIRLGDSPFAGSEKVFRFLQLTQSATMSQVGLGFQLAKGPAVDATNDTGILNLLANGSLASSIREGTASPTGDLYGQFSRVSFPFGRLAFTAGLQTVPGINSGVFVAQPGMMATLVARKGDAAPGAGGAVFGTFLGETVNASAKTMIRATVSGFGVNATNNQGLWSNHSGTLAKVARTGELVPGMPGVYWAGFTRFWTGSFGVETQLVFLARLKGAGVNASNDMSLWLVQEDGSLLRLIREGDAMPDHTGARIGAIQNVVYRPDTGLYLVLASLIQSPAGSNQALFAGNTRALPMTASALRLPMLALRKGAAYKSQLGGATTVKSLRVGTSCFDATGAGHKGLASPINSFGIVAITVTFSDGSVELMRGQP